MRNKGIEVEIDKSLIPEEIQELLDIEFSSKKVMMFFGFMMMDINHLQQIYFNISRLLNQLIIVVQKQTI